jgi:DNA polymerase-3 subunit epsilon
VSARRVVVVDVETTGLNPLHQVAVEVAWWDLDTGERGVFVPPHSDFDMQHAEPRALELNGYYDRGLDNPNGWDWGGKELGRLHDVLQGQTLAGSNPRFDAAFLHQLFVDDAREPEPWHHRLLDVSAYAAGVLGLVELPGLSAVCEQLGVAPGDHTAAADVTAAGRALLELRERRAGLTAARTAPNPHAVVLDSRSALDAEAVARAAMNLPTGRKVRASDLQYGRRIIELLAGRAS